MDRLLISTASGVLLAVIVTVLLPNPSVAIECSKNKSHNIFMGTKQYNDLLLYTDHIKKDGNLLWGYVSADFDTGDLQKRINYIEVIDGYTDGKGGCAYLTNGGVGSYRAAFHLKATENRGGLNFTIKVFGR